MDKIKVDEDFTFDVVEEKEVLGDLEHFLMKTEQTLDKTTLTGQISDLTNKIKDEVIIIEDCDNDSIHVLEENNAVIRNESSKQSASVSKDIKSEIICIDDEDDNDSDSVIFITDEELFIKEELKVEPDSSCLLTDKNSNHIVQVKDEIKPEIIEEIIEVSSSIVELPQIQEKEVSGSVINENEPQSEPSTSADVCNTKSSTALDSNETTTSGLVSSTSTVIRVVSSEFLFPKPLDCPEEQKQQDKIVKNDSSKPQQQDDKSAEEQSRIEEVEKNSSSKPQTISFTTVPNENLFTNNISTAPPKIPEQPKPDPQTVSFTTVPNEKLFTNKISTSQSSTSAGCKSLDKLSRRIPIYSNAKKCYRWVNLDFEALRKLRPDDFPTNKLFRMKVKAPDGKKIRISIPPDPPDYVPGELAESADNSHRFCMRAPDGTKKYIVSEFPLNWSKDFGNGEDAKKLDEPTNDKKKIGNDEQVVPGSEPISDTELDELPASTSKEQNNGFNKAKEKNVEKDLLQVELQSTNLNSPKDSSKQKAEENKKQKIETSFLNMNAQKRQKPDASVKNDSLVSTLLREKKIQEAIEKLVSSDDSSNEKKDQTDQKEKKVFNKNRNQNVQKRQNVRRNNECQQKTKSPIISGTNSTSNLPTKPQNNETKPSPQSNDTNDDVDSGIGSAKKIDNVPNKQTPRTISRSISTSSSSSADHFQKAPERKILPSSIPNSEITLNRTMSVPSLTPLSSETVNTQSSSSSSGYFQKPLVPPKTNLREICTLQTRTSSEDFVQPNDKNKQYDTIPVVLNGLLVPSTASNKYLIVTTSVPNIQVAPQNVPQFSIAFTNHQPGSNLNVENMKNKVTQKLKEEQKGPNSRNPKQRARCVQRNKILVPVQSVPSDAILPNSNLKNKAQQNLESPLQPPPKKICLEESVKNVNIQRQKPQSSVVDASAKKPEGIDSLALKNKSEKKPHQNLESQPSSPPPPKICLEESVKNSSTQRQQPKSSVVDASAKKPEAFDSLALKNKAEKKPYQNLECQPPPKICIEESVKNSSTQRQQPKSSVVDASVKKPEAIDSLSSKNKAEKRPYQSLECQPVPSKICIVESVKNSSTQSNQRQQSKSSVVDASVKKPEAIDSLALKNKAEKKPHQNLECQPVPSKICIVESVKNSSTQSNQRQQPKSSVVDASLKKPEASDSLGLKNKVEKRPHQNLKCQPPPSPKIGIEESVKNGSSTQRQQPNSSVLDASAKKPEAFDSLTLKNKTEKRPHQNLECQPLSKICIEESVKNTSTQRQQPKSSNVGASAKKPEALALKNKAEKRPPHQNRECPPPPPPPLKISSEESVKNGSTQRQQPKSSVVDDSGKKPEAFDSLSTASYTPTDISRPSTQPKENLTKLPEYTSEMKTNKWLRRHFGEKDEAATKKHASVKKLAEQKNQSSPQRSSSNSPKCNASPVAEQKKNGSLMRSPTERRPSHEKVPPNALNHHLNASAMRSPTEKRLSHNKMSPSTSSSSPHSSGTKVNVPQRRPSHDKVPEEKIVHRPITIVQRRPSSDKVPQLVNSAERRKSLETVPPKVPQQKSTNVVPSNFERLGLPHDTVIVAEVPTSEQQGRQYDRKPAEKRKLNNKEPPKVQTNDVPGTWRDILKVPTVPPRASAPKNQASTVVGTAAGTSAVQPVRQDPRMVSYMQHVTMQSELEQFLKSPGSRLFTTEDGRTYIPNYTTLLKAFNQLSNAFVLQTQQISQVQNVNKKRKTNPKSDGNFNAGS